MQVNIFNNILALKPKTTDLDKIVQMMCFSQVICHRTQVCMRHAKWKHAMKVKDMKKKRFPAFAPCAVMNGGKAREDVMELTDLCYLDFDNIKEEEKFVKAMQVLRNDKNVVMASRSVSGFGLLNTILNWACLQICRPDTWSISTSFLLPHSCIITQWLNP